MLLWEIIDTKRLEVILLLNLIPALQVKNLTIFDLVGQPFQYGEFVCYSQLAAHLGKLAGISAEDAQEVGILSELLYLSSKLHDNLSEQVESTPQLRTELQMPVLLGDLMYGRFLSSITVAGKKEILPVYIEYLQQFNAKRIEMLRHDIPDESVVFYVGLLADKTAEVIARLAGMHTERQLELKRAAEAFMQKQWQKHTEAVHSLMELEQMLQAETCQGI